MMEEEEMASVSQVQGDLAASEAVSVEQAATMVVATTVVAMPGQVGCMVERQAAQPVKVEAVESTVDCWEDWVGVD